MITLILAKFWPAIVGLVTLVGSIVFAWGSKKASDAKIAKAQQQVAESQASVAQARNAEAQANATAAEAGEHAVVNAEQAQAQAQAISDDDVRQQLAALGTLRKDQP
jgi:hypothetical protein